MYTKKHAHDDDIQHGHNSLWNRKKYNRRQSSKRQIHNASAYWILQETKIEWEIKRKKNVHTVSSIDCQKYNKTKYNRL